MVEQDVAGEDDIVLGEVGDDVPGGVGRTDFEGTPAVADPDVELPSKVLEGSVSGMSSK